MRAQGLAGGVPWGQSGQCRGKLGGTERQTRMVGSCLLMRGVPGERGEELAAGMQREPAPQPCWGPGSEEGRPGAVWGVSQFARLWQVKGVVSIIGSGCRKGTELCVLALKENKGRGASRGPQRLT